MRRQDVGVEPGQGRRGTEANRTSLPGNPTSWAEALETIRQDPAQRLSIAVRHLPKPAAFREACRALRARINERYEAGQPWDDELFALHRLAAIASVASHEQLEVTAFSVIEQLDISPAAIGWEGLALLGHKDFQMMADLWGSPAVHTTGAALYPQVAVVASASLAAIRASEQTRRIADIEGRLRPGFPEDADMSQPGLVSRLSTWLRRSQPARSATR
ncbi:MAG TPA: hypothetical protein VF509_04170 [Sphingobium sp.]